LGFRTSPHYALININALDLVHVDLDGVTLNKTARVDLAAIRDPSRMGWLPASPRGTSKPLTLDVIDLLLA